MNSIHVIRPYRYHGGWVFDDPAAGLVREAFVAGADTILDVASAGAESITLRFAAEAFPGYNLKLERQHREYGGTWYRSHELGLDGWLCPALFKYFPTAPKTIYVQVME